MFVGGTGVKIELGIAVSVETIVVADTQDINARLTAKIEMIFFVFIIP